ncbi:unnamed protein product [Mytilus coruscus]|uniref:DDE Tnp4 domain-containing protein n=1 Tax=Mytilus coruscus TaxID=42192 RepID=A0A6J8A4E7_MYTCO|nr:unnamed protein product [Mytilus coruscus]
METATVCSSFFLSLIRKNRKEDYKFKAKNRFARLRRMKKYLMARNNLLLMNRRSNLQPAERRIWSKPRSRNWWDCIVPGFTDAEWIQNFRINKETFDFLKENLHDTLVKCDTPFRKALTVDLKIASTLWQLASNCEYRTVAHLFGIARSTACSAFHDVITSINETLAPRFIRNPTKEKFKDIIDGFQNKWGFPNTIGAIDGTHIPILAPKEVPADYHNRAFIPLFYRQLLTPHIRFGMSILTEQRGNVVGNELDKRFNNTTITPFIIGDAAYPLMPWLIKPFRDNGALSAEKRYFNYMLSRARMVVENAFGRLKGRWRCLMKRNDSSTLFVPDVAECCCTLHNICETFLNEFPEEWLEQEEMNNAPIDCQAATQTGERVRNTIINYLLQEREQ